MSGGQSEGRGKARKREEGRRKREDTSLLWWDCTCWRVHRKGPWSVRYWSTPGCRLTTLSPWERRDKPWGGGCTKASNKLTQPCCRLCFEAPVPEPSNSSPGPSNSRAQLHTHLLRLCGAFPAWSHAGCLYHWELLVPPPASLQWVPLPGGRQHNQQLQAKLQGQEANPGLWSSLVWHWHPPLGPSCLQKCWETLTQFADDLCSAVYFKHKQLPVINKQDLNTLET